MPFIENELSTQKRARAEVSYPLNLLKEALKENYLACLGEFGNKIVFIVEEIKINCFRCNKRHFNFVSIVRDDKQAQT